jgi:GNAT superfamily N-acetyltransferase
MDGNWQRKVLSAKSDLTGFDCTDGDILGLNKFIHDEALNYQREGAGVTHLFYRDDKLVGYITLAMCAVKKEITDIEEGYDDEKINYPALWLGRLAVDNNERGKGIGTFLLDYCIGFAGEKAIRELGCRCIVLVTKGKERIEFYKKRDFEILDIKLKDGKKMMYYKLDLEKARQKFGTEPV